MKSVANLENGYSENTATNSNGVVDQVAIDKDQLTSRVLWQALESRLPALTSTENPIEAIRNNYRTVLSCLREVNGSAHFYDSLTGEIAQLNASVLMNEEGYGMLIDNLVNAYQSLNIDLNNPEELASRTVKQLLLGALIGQSNLAAFEQNENILSLHRQVEEQTEFVLFSILYGASNQ